MRRGHKAIVIACTVLVLISMTTSHAWAAGLHFTKAEVAIWRARKDKGPYKDEWGVILNRANSWLESPDPRWAGNTKNVCWEDAGLSWPDRRLDAGLRDAAFVYLITDDSSYRDGARDELIAQTKVPGTDWTNDAKWCKGNNSATSKAHNIAHWLRRLVYGYSYIRDSLTAGDRTILDAWFLAAGQYFELVVHNVVAKRFANRLDDDYTCTGGGNFCPGLEEGLLHFGGPTAYNFHGFCQNQIASTMATATAIGVVVNDATLKARGKRYVKEFVKYGTWPGGQVMDQHRWNGATPQHGFLYMAVALGSVITMADHLARDGDTEPYQFTTTEGRYGTEGGPKSLLTALQHFAGMTNGTVIEYASTVATNNPDLIIDQEAEAAFGQTRVEFVNITPANVFYQDSEVAKAYQTPIPSRFDGSGCDMLSGDWCTYPRIRFMFGQMEGKVWPSQRIK